MSSIMQVYDYAPELFNNIVADIKEASEKSLTEQVIKLFYDTGLTVKVKHIFLDTPNAYYRVLCFIKKSAESVIINTRNDLGKDGVVDGFNIQIRIVNHNIFNNLNQFTENIQNQIVNAHDCL